MPEDLFQSFLTKVASKYGAKVKYKDQSWLMKFISWILFFNKSFMVDYITTIGKTIYFPSAKWIKSSSSTKLLAHETVHIRDRRKIPGLYELIYLFPQALALLSLLSVFAFTNQYWLLCILFLLFLTPLPAYGRVYYEARAYSMSMYFSSLTSDDSYLPQLDLDRYLEQFIGKGYFYMCWSKAFAKKMLWNFYVDLPNSDPLFMEVEDWFLQIKKNEYENETKMRKSKSWL